MRVLVDMNLPPSWQETLEKAGHEATHWSDVAPGDAADSDIMQWARANDSIVFTHDLDFTALLAATQAVKPSVIQLRADDVLPDVHGDSIIRVLDRFAEALDAGALVSVDPVKARVRMLPFGHE